MSVNRSLKERWINGFKLAFFASILFALVGLPFSLAEDVLKSLVRGQGCGTAFVVWLSYGAVALLVYPVLFDWIASAFRIQFVHKAIPRPVASAVAKKSDPAPPS